MYPVVIFPLLCVCGDVKRNGSSVSFKARMVRGGNDTASIIYSFVAFDEMVQRVQDLKTGDMISARAEINHFTDQKGKERDTYKLMSCSKIAGISDNASCPMYPTVTFPNVKIVKVELAKKKNGEDYLKIFGEERSAANSRPLRLFTIFNEKKIQQVQNANLQQGDHACVLGEVHSYIDKDLIVRSSYTILDMDIRYRKAEIKKEQKPEPEETPKVFEEAVPEKKEEETKEDVHEQQYTMSDFEALFA